MRKAHSTGSAYLRGGQTVFHNLDMHIEIIMRMMIAPLMWAVLCFAIVTHMTNDDEQTDAILVAESKILKLGWSAGAPGHESEVAGGVHLQHQGG